MLDAVPGSTQRQVGSGEPCNVLVGGEVRIVYFVAFVPLFFRLLDTQKTSDQVMTQHLVGQITRFCVANLRNGRLDVKLMS